MEGKERTIYINPNSKHSTNADESESEEDNEGPQGVVGILSKFADKCSVSGMPFITQAENRLVRIIWSCLLLAAFGLMTFHLYKLNVTYFEYKKQTQVQMSFSNLQFPAVTICNVNPMKMSQRDLASNEVNEFIDRVDPDVIMNELEEWSPELEELDEDYYEDEEIHMETLESVDSGFKKRRRKRQTGSSNNATNYKEKGNGSKKKPQGSKKKEKLRTNNFFDDFDLGIDNIVVDGSGTKTEGYAWEAGDDTSGLYKLEQSFRRLFVMEPSSTRSHMGHQIHDMLLQCSFAGRKCVARNFTRSLTTEYGNCYTLQSPKFVSRRSGPSDGLQLKLFLETDDYLPGIATGKGVQVVIHDQGTLPFPEAEGLAVKAGTETYIGLRRVEVSRLGSPYGKCTQTADFQNQHGVLYTRNACQKVCMQKRITHMCGCYDSMQQEANRVLKRSKNVRPCQTHDELQCVHKISLRFQKDNDICGCYRPCKETSFEKTVTSRIWPNTAFAKLMSSAACKQDSPVCEGLSDKGEADLREEFVKLVIFYEDLNYETLSESADYELDQFLSDIGGTIGLWIGLSLLSLFEVIHLFIDIILYVCCANRPQK